MANSSSARWASRFWSYVDTESDPRCWIWLGSRAENGRGFFNAKELKRNSLAHRVMFELVRGEIPKGALVLHTCNRGAEGCVTPSHLYLGDHKSNARDRTVAGNWRNGHLPGYREKLRPEQVRQIRTYGLLGQSQAEIGRRYGVSAHTIRRILNGQTWRKVAV